MSLPVESQITAHMPQFTFLISFSWNNLGLPVIQDKLALGSEVLIKVLVPFVGKSLPPQWIGTL